MCSRSASQHKQLQRPCTPHLSTGLFQLTKCGIAHITRAHWVAARRRVPRAGSPQTGPSLPSLPPPEAAPRQLLALFQPPLDNRGLSAALCSASLRSLLRGLCRSWHHTCMTCFLGLTRLYRTVAVSRAAYLLAHRRSHATTSMQACRSQAARPGLCCLGLPGAAS